ncbi:MAG: radical SAM protein [Planctomycetota bacterium]
MVIDSGNICQLKCPLCPTGVGRPTREKCFMKFENFKKIVDEAGSYLCEIDLYNWGEPFLNKDIFRMIEYAKKAGIKVSISSHLNTLKEEWIHSIIRSKLDHLIVSLDGASRESYQKYRIGGNYDVVISNMKKLINLKKKYKSKYPRVTWQYLVMRQNEEEVDKSRQKAAEIGVDDLDLRPMRCDMGKEPFLNDKEKVESITEWLPREKKYSRYNYETEKKNNHLSRCLFLTTTMVINANGSVSPCCGVYDEKWDFGNVFEDGVFHVWNNMKYQEARKTVLSKHTSNKDLICAYCVKNGLLSY